MITTKTMSHNCINSISCGSTKENSLDTSTLEGIVSTYLRDYAPAQASYLRFYQAQKSLHDAVRKAALAELRDSCRFSHQSRIPNSVLQKAQDALLKLDYDGLGKFSDLYALVGDALRPIRGIGLLTIYDTAHRIGAFLNLKPEEIYLHAGVRKGAKALGLEDWRDKLHMSEFPAPFQCLTPEQTEDCLCIFSPELEALRRKGRSRYGN